MKFRTTLVCLFLCVCMLLSACTKNSQLSAYEITDNLKSLSSTIKWTELNGDQLSSYFGFSDSDCEDFKVYVNSVENHFDIVAAIKPINNNSRQEILKGFNFVKDKASLNFKNSNDTEYKKISSGLVYTANQYLILVIMDSYDLVNSYFKEINATIAN